MKRLNVHFPLLIERCNHYKYIYFILLIIVFLIERSFPPYYCEIMTFFFLLKQNKKVESFVLSVSRSEIALRSTQRVECVWPRGRHLLVD